MVPDTTHSCWTWTGNKKKIFNLSKGLVSIHSGENKASVHWSHNIMASFFIRQLAEQFWSVNLITSAFEVWIPNISNQDITKVHLLGNHTYSGINISAWRQNNSCRSSEKIEDVLMFVHVSHVETSVTCWYSLHMSDSDVQRRYWFRSMVWSTIPSVGYGFNPYCALGTFLTFFVQTWQSFSYGRLSPP